MPIDIISHQKASDLNQFGVRRPTLPGERRESACARRPAIQIQRQARVFAHLRKWDKIDIVLVSAFDERCCLLLLTVLLLKKPWDRRRSTRCVYPIAHMINGRTMRERRAQVAQSTCNVLRESKLDSPNNVDCFCLGSSAACWYVYCFCPVFYAHLNFC